MTETTASTPDRELSVGALLRRNRVAAALVVAAFIALSTPTVVRLVSQWTKQPEYSYAFLVPIVCAVLLIADRKRLGAVAARPSRIGLVVVVASLTLHVIGASQSINTFERLGLWGALLGGVGLCLGWAVIRANAFPFLYLLLAFPPPFILATPVRMQLQSVVTRLSSEVLLFLGAPALPEGNVLVMGDYRLEVVDACSGVRSLMGIIATAILLAYVFRTGWWRGILLVATAVPVTIATNVARITAVGASLQHLDLDLTVGAPHEIIGVAAFGLALVLLYLSLQLYRWALGQPTPRGTS